MIYTHIASALIAAVLAASGAWKIQDSRIYHIKAEHAQAVADAQAKAEAKAQAMQDTKDEALRHANQRAIAERNAAADARGELDKLRSDIAARDAAKATASTGPDAAATARALLADCAARYSELAQKADRHAGDAVMLQDAWPR